MIRTIRLIIVFLMAIGALDTFAADGLVTIKSAHSVNETAQRLENVLKAKGMTVFTRINHTAGAKKAGLSLRPTQVIIFGNPKVGTLLMQCAQTTAIDLPQKALIYQDDHDQVWLAYNAPEYLNQRHDLKACQKPLKKINAALANFAKKATQK